MKKQPYQKLDEIFEEHKENNWGGYEEFGSNRKSFNHGEQLIDNLPDDIPLPDLSIGPDGCVHLEWYKTTRNLLSLSPSPDGQIALAWLDYGEKGCETLPYNEGFLPDHILEKIREIMTTSYHLIKDGEFIGNFPTFKEGLEKGYKLYGNVKFEVKKLPSEIEIVL